MEFILLPFSLGSYEMVGVSNHQILKTDGFGLFYFTFFFFTFMKHSLIM